MMEFTDSFHCTSRAHCRACRAQSPMHGMEWPIECPYGVTLENLPAPTSIQPQEWPLLAQPLKLLAKPEDKGLGDIVARTIGPIGGDAFKVWYKTIFGKSCGCEVRQENWNQKYPL